MDFGKMNNLRPEGSNGSPDVGNQIDLATALYSQQRLTIIPPRSVFIFGEYKLFLSMLFIIFSINKKNLRDKKKGKRERSQEGELERFFSFQLALTDCFFQESDLKMQPS